MTIMRTNALILAAVLTALTASAGPTPRPSPELVMQRGGGPPLTLSQFRGKIVALALTHTTCEHCQTLTRVLNVIQKDYAARNVQVVECSFEEGANINYPMFVKALQPNFPTGYTTDAAIRKFLKWDDTNDGNLMIPYMLFIDARGIIRGDFSGKDGFFGKMDERIRAELNKMTKSAAAPAPAAKKK
jgi:thiol-disulfide isomerase/thioredoxin